MMKKSDNVDRKREKRFDMRGLMGLLLLILLIIIAWAQIDVLPVVGDPNSAPNTHVSVRYIEEGPEVTGADNMVTGILADYRGFDTLLETTVMLLSAMAVSMILSNKLKGRWDSRIFGNVSQFGGINARIMAPLLVPILLLYGLYVLFHGEVSLGGGFQAGALFALAYIMYTTVANLKINGIKTTQHFFICIGAVGVMIYFLMALLPILFGGNALEYGKLPVGEAGHGRHALGILMIEIGVTICVMSSIITILQAVLERSNLDE